MVARRDAGRAGPGERVGSRQPGLGPSLNANPRRAEGPARPASRRGRGSHAGRADPRSAEGPPAPHRAEDEGPTPNANPRRAEGPPAPRRAEDESALNHLPLRFYIRDASLL